MNSDRIFSMPFSKVYPLYIQKAEKKNRPKADVDSLIYWLTSYDALTLKRHLDENSSFQTFFSQAPQIHPNAVKITGVVCGVRVENIEDELMRKIRYLDKLIDELAKGKAMEKIMR